MDSPNVARIVGADMTVSDKIRALDAEGYPRADIARVLGKRYQHVRNVLEADKLHPPKEKPVGADLNPGVPNPGVPNSGVPNSGVPDSGVQDAGRHFESSQRLSVEAGGVVRLPPELLAVLQAKPGSVVIAEVQDDGVKLFSNSGAWDRVRALVREFGIDPNRDLVAELIAERRAEAARDD